MERVRRAALLLCVIQVFLISIPNPVHATQSNLTCSSVEASSEMAPMAMLPIQPISQVCQNWCWSAVITMVNNYYGRSTMLCQPPSIKTGLNCCNWAACSYAACNNTAKLPEMANIFGRFGISGVVMNGPVNQATLNQEISSGRPVIVALYGSFAGHVVLITGFSSADPYGHNTVYRVYDPYYGPTTVPYRSLINSYNNGSMYWGATILALRPHF